MRGCYHMRLAVQGDHISGKRFHSPLPATAQRPSWRDIFHFCLWLIKLPWRYATGRGAPLWGGEWFSDRCVRRQVDGFASYHR